MLNQRLSGAGEDASEGEAEGAPEREFGQ